MKEITFSCELVTGKTKFLVTFTPLSIKEIAGVLNLGKKTIRIVLKEEAKDLAHSLHKLLVKKINDSKVDEESPYDEKMYSDLKFFANVIPQMMITEKNQLIKHFSFICE